MHFVDNRYFGERWELKLSGNSICYKSICATTEKSTDWEVMKIDLTTFN